MSIRVHLVLQFCHLVSTQCTTTESGLIRVLIKCVIKTYSEFADSFGNLPLELKSDNIDTEENIIVGCDINPLMDEKGAVFSLRFSSAGKGQFLIAGIF